ncbi:MAG: hypothetical protein HQL15_10165 [Candidatus Omnitrophica bacterium]|nr:hypothetical protein [Candidatus Omnitrophota bacterium]
MLALLAVCCLTIAQAETLSLDDFANQAMVKIQNADFNKLFDDFILPKEYTAQDTKREKEAITAAFEYLKDKIGLPGDFKKVDSTSDSLVTMDLATGTPETTGNLPSTNLLYKTTFSKEGAGYVLVGIYNDGEKLYIKKITFGLLQSSNSIQIVKDWFKFGMDLTKEQQKKYSNSSQQ